MKDVRYIKFSFATYGWTNHIREMREMSPLKFQNCPEKFSDSQRQSR